MSFPVKTKWTIYHNSYKIQFDSTTLTQLYIPAQILSYGLYELNLTVTMLNLTSSESISVEIYSSGITANLIPYETSMITRGNQQELKLDSGNFSINPDGYAFNASVSLH
jgi:hypothetical protein